jgi:hypothetical protein
MLKIFGKCNVFIDKVTIDDFELSAFGKNSFEIKTGEIKNKKIIAFGENLINTVQVNNKTTDIKSTGENSFRLNVYKKLNISTVGKCILFYRGNPIVNKGITLGDLTIKKIDY